MQYKHLTGNADVMISDGVPTNNHFMSWQKLQLSLNLWWNKHEETIQVP